MTEYRYLVTLRTNDEDIVAGLLKAIKGREVSLEISAFPNQGPAKAASLKIESTVKAPRKPRKQKRASKVNAAILKAMSEQPASVAAIKASLVEAGMSASSLSTGIAALTKSGQIQHVGAGMYGLASAK